ncbi:class F sortase [Arthrobacter sp. 260]|uniref:class F sortase n=1 Tax=Arthrobacter sp. 260 TaxID=2735314 RepID=UPI00149253E6|nr:class F sortase [Arthrobacter sp. 260]NOJ60867.1 class F sortase [Arthrobacter sp. 260]
MISTKNGRRRGFAVSAATALLILTGCAAEAPPQDTGSSSSAAPSSVASPEASPSPAPSPSASAEPSAAASPAPSPELPAVLEASKPASFNIPTIGAESELLHLGLRDNGSLEVPPDGPGAPASWYDQSPTSGERGPSVLLGHVNATGGGPGVFADLRALQPGDEINVVREDGTTAVFAVDRGEQYQKDNFPTLEVYGNTEAAELRLITCDGYNPDTGEFDDNYVVYATLVP